ncbi:MAG: hypothetical protein V2B15_08220 [Bacteroidota bacterium]
MEQLNEFKKLLRQIMSQDLKPIYNQEEIDQTVRKIEVMELVGEKYVVWLN